MNFAMPSTVRAAPRMNINTIAIVRGIGSQVMRTRDVSEVGLFMFSGLRPSFSIEIGHQLDLDLYALDTAVHCKGIISRIVIARSTEAFRYPNGFAVNFIYDDAHRFGMAKLVETLRSRPAPIPPQRSRN